MWKLNNREGLISKVQSLTGWSLSAISLLDIEVPGIAGHMLRASDEQRQVIAAYLSTFPRGARDTIQLPDDAGSRRDIANRLLTADHRSLLRDAFEHVPLGFRGALRRSGPQPHLPRYYKLLWHLLRCPRRPEIADVIRQLDEISLPRLTVACALPSELLHPEMVSRVRNRAEARDLADAIDILRRHAIDSKTFADGLRRLRRRGDVREYVEKWVLRCRFAPSPVPLSERYQPIRDGVALSRKALEYRNCSRSYALDLLEGKASMGEFFSSHGNVLVMLVHRDGEWLLDDVHCDRNEEVDEAVRAQAVDFLRLQGISERRRPRRKETPFSSLRRLLPRGVWL